MATRYANKQEAEEAAHTLSHQPWMPLCSWKVIEREDGTAYVHGTMDASIPEGEDRAQLDALRHYLGGQFRAATAGSPRSWHGRYGKAEICVLMPWRTQSGTAAPRQRSRPEPPEMAPCREAELLEENTRLRQVIAHLMTNPLGQREATYWTSDIDGQTGAVELIDGPDDQTTIRITDRATEK